jgi:DNA-binding transcriptional MerR regulator
MKISEVMKATGLTKKAIYYYEEEGLVSPQKDRDNNYRSYSEDDVNKLIQISVLRKLDIPLSVIYEVLKNKLEIKAVMKRQLEVIENKINYLYRNKDIIQNLMEKLNGSSFKSSMNEIEALNSRLMLDARADEGYMQKELDRLFPDNLGKIFSIFYAQFLDEPLDSDEKVKAWEELVNMLDALDEIEYSVDIKRIINDYYGKITNDELAKIEKKSRNTINIILSREGAPSEEKVLEAKKKLEEYYDDPQYSSDQEDNHIFQQFVLTHRALFEEMDQYMVILSKRFGKYRDILCSSGLNN